MKPDRPGGQTAWTPVSSGGFGGSGGPQRQRSAAGRSCPKKAAAPDFDRHVRHLRLTANLSLRADRRRPVIIGSGRRTTALILPPPRRAKAPLVLICGKGQREKTQGNKKVIATEESVSVDMTKTLNAASLLVPCTL